MDMKNTPAGTGGLLGATGLTDPKTAAAVAIQTREASKTIAMVQAAKAFPRDRAACEVEMDKACSDPGLAADAIYRFPREGSEVRGPSIRLAEEAWSAWGNGTAWLEVLEHDDTRVKIRGVAWDMERNVEASLEDDVALRIQRKGPDGETRWRSIAGDEREIRELVGRRGSILVRNAILRLLPVGMIDRAMAACERTTAAQAKKGGADREKLIARMVAFFAKRGIGEAALEDRLGCPVAEATGEQVAELRGIAKSIADGHTRVGDHFEVESQPAGGDDPLGDFVDRAEGGEDDPFGSAVTEAPDDR